MNAYYDHGLSFRQGFAQSRAFANEFSYLFVLVTDSLGPVDELGLELRLHNLFDDLDLSIRHAQLRVEIYLSRWITLCKSNSG